MKRCLTALAAAFLLCFAAAAAPVETQKVLVLDPMLDMLVQFIGGPHISTDCAQTWDARDQLVTSRRRVMGAAALPVPLLALDARQYEDFLGASRRRSGLTQAEREREVRFLFPDGLRSGTATEFYGDPANLPYTAQQVMNALCDLVPQRFDYFQRRLGEFNARLRSVLISGRRRLAGVKVLCLSEICRPFLEASGAVVSAPTRSELYRFRLMAEAEDRQAALSLAEQMRDGRLIVFDWNTESAVRRALTAYAGGVYLAPPRGEDLLFYVQRLVLDIGNRFDRMRNPARAR